ncbi:MAG: hypothetical protein AAES65_21970 [Candidatus Thiodiazotropha sp. (ex. Lucinoma kazani)]
MLGFTINILTCWHSVLAIGLVVTIVNIEHRSGMEVLCRETRLVAAFRGSAGFLQ